MASSGNEANTDQIEVGFLPPTSPSAEQSSISPASESNVVDITGDSTVLTLVPSNEGQEIEPSSEGQGTELSNEGQGTALSSEGQGTVQLSNESQGTELSNEGQGIEISNEGQAEGIEVDPLPDDGKGRLSDSKKPSVEIEPPSNGNIINGDLRKDRDMSATSPSFEIPVPEKGNSETDMRQLNSETDLRADLHPSLEIPVPEKGNSESDIDMRQLNSGTYLIADEQTEISHDKAANGTHNLPNGSAQDATVRNLEKDLFDVSDYVAKGPSRYLRSLKMLMPFRSKPKE